MSLLSDLGLTEKHLSDCSPSVRDRILLGYSKLKGLDLLTATQIFRRDSKRLDAITRAVRRTQGLRMPDDPDDEIVLGDKITQSGGGVSVCLLVITTAVAAAALTALGLTWMAGGKGEAPSPEAPPAVEIPADTATDVRPGFGTPEYIGDGQ